jgi:hypothetical protein
MSAEYVLNETNFNVVPCERRIRTFETNDERSSRPFSEKSSRPTSSLLGAFFQAGRFKPIFSIRELKVVGFTPKSSAAPSTPLIFQLAFVRTAKMFSRSRRRISASVRYSGSAWSTSRGPKEVRSTEEAIPATSNSRAPPRAKITARSMTLRSGEFLSPPWKFSGSSPPRFRVVYNARPEAQGAAAAGRETRNRRTPHGKVHYRSDTPPFQNVMVLSKATAAPSVTHRRPTHSPRQRSELAAFGSSKALG